MFVLSVALSRKLEGLRREDGNVGRVGFAEKDATTPDSEHPPTRSPIHDTIGIALSILDWNEARID